MVTSRIMFFGVPAGSCIFFFLSEHEKSQLAKHGLLGFGFATHLVAFSSLEEANISRLSSSLEVSSVPSISTRSRYSFGVAPVFTRIKIHESSTSETGSALRPKAITLIDHTP